MFTTTLPPHAQMDDLFLNIMPPHSKQSASPHLSNAINISSLHKLQLQDLRPIATVGRGNMGTVLLVAATLPTSTTIIPLAMKVIKKDASRKTSKLQRSQSEKHILSMLHHPFLPSLYAHFESDNHTFLLTQFCSTGDLNVLRHQQPDKRFSDTAARFYGAEVLLALEYLHKHGIVYRDLKPENVLIQESGHIMLTDFDLSLELEEENEVTKPTTQMKAGHSITDVEHETMRNSASLFSLYACILPWLTIRRFSSICDCDAAAPSKLRLPSKKTRVVAPLQQQETRSTNLGGIKERSCTKYYDESTYSFVGTEEYVAPEMLLGDDHGFAVDWWAFGIFMHELVYGRTPFKSETRKETFLKIVKQEPDLPGFNSPLKDLIRRLLAKDPAERLGSRGGAEEVKKHDFFYGLKWDSVEDVLRPPFLPCPFSLPEYIEERKQHKKLWKKSYDHPEGIIYNEDEIW